jgi:hypothetical protein
MPFKTMNLPPPTNTKSQTPHMSSSAVVLPCCNQVEVSWSRGHSFGSPVPSLASHAVHPYQQCSLLQHSIAIMILYTCLQKSSFTVRDKQGNLVCVCGVCNMLMRLPPNKKEWRRTGQFRQSFLHFTDKAVPNCEQKKSKLATRFEFELFVSLVTKW